MPEQVVVEPGLTDVHAKARDQVVLDVWDKPFKVCHDVVALRRLTGASPAKRSEVGCKQMLEYGLNKTVLLSPNVFFSFLEQALYDFQASSLCALIQQ